MLAVFAVGGAAIQGPLPKTRVRSMPCVRDKLGTVFERLEVGKLLKSDNEMFRLSRIHAPRATALAFALVAVVLLAFGWVADAHVADVSSVAMLPELAAPDWSAALRHCVASFAQEVF